VACEEEGYVIVKANIAVLDIQPQGDLDFMVE